MITEKQTDKGSYEGEAMENNKPCLGKGKEQEGEGGNKEKEKTIPV